MTNQHKKLSPTLPTLGNNSKRLPHYSNQLSEKMYRQINQVKLAAEGIAFSKYADDPALPDNLRNEGLVNRKRYIKALLNSIHEIENELIMEAQKCDIVL